jgi:hypothetical protein
MKRTYDWNGHNKIPISGPDLTDVEVASMVRMLMRSQLNHEMICTLGRDRIMCLVKEKAKMREALEDIANSGNTGDNAPDIAMKALDEGLI